MVHTDQNEDPVIAEIIEASIRPSIGRVSPELLEDMRLVLTVFLTTHPEAVRAVDSLRPRAALSNSGDTVRGPLATEAPTSQQRSGTLGRPR
jgi:hypothetical protein